MGNAIVQSATIQLKDQGGGVFGSVTPVLGNGITSVTGTIADGQTLTIAGLGFGADGPSNYNFNDFSGGTDGIEATTSNTNFDEISPFWPPLFTTDSRSGSLASRFFRQKNGGDLAYAASIQTVNLGAVTEVFKSFAVKVPAGKYFPGAGGGNAGTNADYSTSSSWKMDWLLGPDSATNDLITATHIGHGQWVSGGNDLGNLEALGADPTWWKWNAWNRMTQWAKAGAIPQTNAGNLYTQIANGVDAITEFSSTPVIFATGQAPYVWNDYHINGWSNSDGSNNANVELIYDDCYIAWGDNSAARVELGNAATYTACTDLAICETSNANWSNGTLTTTAREGGLNLAANTWLFVTLPDNVTRYSYQVVTV